MKKINILGTVYTIVIKKYDEDDAFGRGNLCGYCDGVQKQIVICDLATVEMCKHESIETIRLSMNETLRHEIVHAFLDESGLASSSLNFEGGWAKNEEMIDWFAIQGPKIYAAWKEVKAL